MRGYRNNNPCNIRCSSEKWQGKIVPSKDKEFEQFETMAYGFRATFKLLQTYQKKYKTNTINDIINKFAPASENNVSAYVNHVVQLTHIDPNNPINTSNKSIMIDLVSAMATHENGTSPNATDVLDGWNLFIN